MVLIGANLIPVAGVLIWDWSIFHVVLLYWLENVIIGGINILKMLTCSLDIKQFRLTNTLQKRAAEQPEKISKEQAGKILDFAHTAEAHSGKIAILNHGSKLFLIPFFTLHYGIFCFGHGIFVFALLGGDNNPSGGFLTGAPSLHNFLGMIQAAVATGGGWAALALALSHLYSFSSNYLGKGEFRRTALPLLMMAPYGRVVVLHVAILFGAFALTMLGSPVFLLLLLIVGKTLLDWKLHLRIHKKILSRQPIRN